MTKRPQQTRTLRFLRKSVRLVFPRFLILGVIFLLGSTIALAALTLDQTSITSDTNLFALPTGAGNLGININTTPSSTLHVSGTALFKGANSTTAFQIQQASGTTVLIIDTTNRQVALGPAAAAANGALTIGTNTAVASGGLYFGTDSNLYRGGAALLQTDSAVLVKPTTNSTTAFQIQDTAGTSQLFIADTTNVRIGIGAISPSSTLHVSGTAIFKAGTASTTAFQVQSSSTSPALSVDTITNRVGISTSAPSNTLHVVGTTKTNSLIVGASGGTYLQVVAASSTLSFGSTAANSSTDLTIAVTGAAAGDVVSLGVANASVPSTGTFFAWVSAAGTVTVRFANNSTTAVTPASGVFTVSATKF